MSQFFLFALIGVFNTAFDFLLWRFLVKIINLEINIFKLKLNKYSISQVLSYSCVTVFSYNLNKIFTFKSEGNFFSFLVVNFVAMVFSTLIINFLTQHKSDILKSRIVLYFDRFIPLLDKNFLSFVKISVVFITMLISFFGYKFLVF